MRCKRQIYILEKSRMDVDGERIYNLEDHQKLKEILTLQFETSENFKINTEKTLNRIKEDFQQMVLVRMVLIFLYIKELEALRKQSTKHKGFKSMEIQNLQDASGKSITTKKSYASKNSIKSFKNNTNININNTNNNNTTPSNNSSKTSTAKTVPKLKLSK